jgi:hypothetical protein
MLKLREDGAGPQGIANALNEARRYKRNGKPWTRHAVWLLLDNYDARQEALAG